MARSSHAETPLASMLKTDGPTVSPHDRVIDAARSLAQAGAGEAPVVDGNGILVGVISEHDILGKRGQDVGSIMSRGVISITRDATAGQAIQLMGLHGVRFLPVVDGERLVGVVTRSDLLRLFVDSRWECDSCGAESYGLHEPVRCAQCGRAGFHPVPTTAAITG